MDKFSIDDESEVEVHSLNPIYIQPLPKFMMEKGTAVQGELSTLYRAIIFKERKGFSSLFLSSLASYERLLYFEDEFLYAFTKHSDYYVVEEAWHLRRIFKINIHKDNYQKMTLYLINKSHKPTDSIKEKLLQVYNYKDFTESLRKALSTCDIDLQ